MKNNEKQWIQSKYKSSYLLLAEIFSCLPIEGMYGEKFMETVLIYFGLPIPSQSCLSKWSRRYFKENINSSNRERRYKLIKYLDRGKLLSNIEG